VRLVFDNLQEFERWISNNVSADKYECYITRELEVILVPTKSTKPLKYAYIKLSSAEDLKIVEKLRVGMGLNVYNIKHLVWADDRLVEGKLE
jgi:hypothetical protein